MPADRSAPNPPAHPSRGHPYAKFLLSDAEITARYLAGEAIASLTRAAGVSEPTLRVRFAALGLAQRQGARQRRRPPTPATLSIAEMARLYAAGQTTAQIAAVAGISCGKVYMDLRAAGVAFRPAWYSPLTPAQRDQLHADLRSGAFPTLQSIARKYGLTREAIRLHAVALGLTRYTRAVRRAAADCRAAAHRAAQVLARAAAARARESWIAALGERWRAGATLAELRQEFQRCRIERTLAQLHRQDPALFPRRPSPRSVASQRRRAEAAARRAQALATLAAARRDRAALVAQLWAEGLPLPEIGQRLGLRDPKSLITELRRAQPDAFPRRHRSTSPAARAALRDLVAPLWAAGVSRREIAHQTGLPDVKTTLRNLRKWFPGAFPYRVGGRPLAVSPAPSALFAKLFHAGATYPEIARQTGLKAPKEYVKRLRRDFPGRFPLRRPSRKPGPAPE